MTPDPAKWTALIRAIGPWTHARMSMQQLRAASQSAGLSDAVTLLATGNLLFTSPLPEAELARILTGILSGHGLENEVFLRRSGSLQQVLADNPFPDAAARHPDHLLVLFMHAPPAETGIIAAQSHAGPERIHVIGREAYIDYADGVARSKLTPARLERIFGQPGTARNWNTVTRLSGKALSPGSRG